MKKLYLITLFLISFYSAHSQCCSNGINLLADYNPDFSAPFTDVPPGFITANPYTFFPTPGTYIIVPSRDYGACFGQPQADHTTNDPINGRFLWFDTSPTASPATPDIAWQPFAPSLPAGSESLISVASNTTYVFSCWIRDLARNPDCITGGAPLMGLRINGQELAEVDLALYTEPCCPQWTYLCAEWNSGDNSSALIQIESRRADGFNDLGIDDVYFGTTTEALEFSLGADTTVCEGVTLVLEDNIENSINLWSTSTTGDTIQVTSPGIYWLEVTKNNCKARDSILVTQDLLPSISLGNDTIICDQIPLLISPENSGGSIANYLWQDNSTSNSLTTNSSGFVWLQASNSCGSSSDSMNISYFIPPSLGNDTNFCIGTEFTLNAGLANVYLWSNGAETSSIVISNSGVYWVQTTFGQCVGSDTVNVISFLFPELNLGNDSAICDNLPFTISLDSTNTYTWSDGSTNSYFVVENAGIYWAETNNGPCFTSDSIDISVISTPSVNFGNDLTACIGETITLNAGFASSYLWSDSSSSSSILVSSPGLYWVEASNQQCVDSDTISISFSNCDCSFSLEIPNSFTPNNDGKNDQFVPKEISCIKEATLRILNRWGTQIYFTNDVIIGWNGSVDSKESPSGTYYWIIDYTTNLNEQNSKAGFVEVVR
jgi:gliding motility-associated-like protein